MSDTADVETLGGPPPEGPPGGDGGGREGLEEAGVGAPAGSESTAAEVTAVLARGVGGVLGIEVLEASQDRVVVTTPVDERVHQPAGLLHGGVSALLAETAASVGGSFAVPTDKAVVGIELNASHLRAMRRGTLRAVATPVRLGRTVQVWAIELTDEADRAICSARCTLAVVDR